MKKVLFVLLSMALVAAISIGGTLAYLQDRDSDVNVMTLGNVSIAQHEYEREVDAAGNYVTYTETKREGNPIGYKLAPFTQAKPLYPAVGEAANYDETKVYFAQLDGNPLGAQSPFDEKELKNAQDKFVFVENTGKTDAYVRTIIAFEIGTAENVMGEPNNANENLIMMNYNQYWTRNFIGAAQIDGNNYYLVEFVYDGANGANSKHPDGIVHPGEFTYCNLAQVYMTPKATNEDVEKIDGNKNGTYDILVLSQAVQATGFSDAKTALDTAFGTSAEKAAEWFGGTAIPSYVFDQEGFDEAMAHAGNINLLSDVEIGGDIKLPTSLNLGGHTLSSQGVEVANDFAVSNGKYVMKDTFQYIDIRPVESDIYTFTNITFVNEVKRKPGNVGTDRIEQILKLYPMATGVKSTFVFENCTFENASVYFGASSDKPADINVIFKNCTFNAIMASDPLIEFNSTITGTVKIEGCTFNIEGTYSNQSVIDIKTWSSITLDVTAVNNVLNANKAVAYTYDPAKGETEVDSVKLGTSNVRNYYLFDCLTGRYSTIVETGTILKGDIAVASK